MFNILIVRTVYANVQTHQNVHIKYMKSLYIDYTSIKLKKMKNVIF